jgi:hypothetical protein
MREESKRQQVGAPDVAMSVSASRDDDLDSNAANTAALSAIDHELGRPVQRRGVSPAEARTEEAVHAQAARGVAGAGQALPHLDRIQSSFGPEHDLSAVRAHVGGEAASASRAIGAEAYATGHDVAFARQPDVFTAAHEAAHVVQQQQGVSLLGGIGREGDAHEQHADAVAARVDSGLNAADLLGPPHSAGVAVVQRKESNEAGELAQHATERTESPQTRTSKIAQLDLQQLRGYVSKSMILASDAFASAVQTAQLRHAMKKPDHSLWEMVIEFYFGAIPVKNVGAFLDDLVGNLGDDALKITADALGGVRGAGKVAAKKALPNDAAGLDGFFADLRDRAREWTQAAILEVELTGDKPALQALAAAFDMSKHTEGHYLPLIQSLMKHYEKEVLAIGREETGHDAGETFYRNTQIGLVTDGKRHRLAVLSNETSDGPNATLLGSVTVAGAFIFERWVDDSVASLAKERQRESFGAAPVVTVDSLRVRSHDGRPVEARGNNPELDHWMDYGDDYNLWPVQ